MSKVTERIVNSLIGGFIGLSLLVDFGIFLVKLALVTYVLFLMLRWSGCL